MDGDTSGGFLAEPKGSAAFLQLGTRLSEGKREMKKRIDITAVPELRTSVGMHGSLKQKEVGSWICATLAVALIYAL
jgi:hypothetical protein